MTKITNITIHGFKSFAKKTHIPLGDRYNCILGPNGSGKSNVGDALCFVLGRLSAKSMRAEKASNLIFNGGKKGKPASSGYVEITFDNTSRVFNVDEDELIINRTVTKKKGSIYSINGKKSTRTNILDLLASASINPSGYNIILQGDITRFVDMPGVERRQIIEQISDISHYEDKKRKAMLELDKVQTKLGDAAIILKERKAHLKELKKDRDQAAEVRDAQEKVNSLKKTRLTREHENYLKQHEDFTSKIGVIKQKIAKQDVSISKYTTLCTTLETQIGDVNQEIESKGESGQVTLHKEIEGLKEQVIIKKARLQTVQDELEKIGKRRTQFQSELDDIESRASHITKEIKQCQHDIKRFNHEIETVKKKRSKLRTKHKLDDSEGTAGEVEILDKEIESLEGTVQKSRSKQQEMFRSKDQLEFKLQNLDVQLNKIASVRKEHSKVLKELENMKKRFKEMSKTLSGNLQKDAEFVAQLSNARGKVVSLRERYGELSTKAAAAKNSIAANAAVKAVLDKGGKGVHGTVGQLGSVNSEYAQAVEAAAGGRSSFIVVDDDLIASQNIQYLRNQRLGRASFIPLNKIKAQRVNSEDLKLLKKSGVVDFAVNLVKAKRNVKKAFEYVLGNTLVVENLSVARAIGVGRIRMVTLTGDTVEGSGVMSGGQSKRRNSFVQTDIIEKAEKVGNELADQEAVIHSIERNREKNHDIITKLRTQKGEIEGTIIKTEKSLHLDSSDLDAHSGQKKEFAIELNKVEDELQTVMLELSGVNKSLAMKKAKRQQLISNMTAAKNPRVVAELQTLDDEQQQLRERIISREQRIKNLDEQKEQLIAPEREKISHISKQINKEEHGFNLELKELQLFIKEQSKVLKVKQKDSEAFYKQYKALFNKREKIQGKLRDTEHAIQNTKEKMYSYERDINVHALKHAEVKAKLSVLTEEMEQYTDAEILDIPNNELEAQLQKSESILRNMPLVNMKALEVYDKVEADFHSLLEKQESLENERTKVLTLMNEIETKKKDHFMKTFDQANKHFQEIFSRLFYKGDAYLQLENKESPFEDGLSVKVKLTGNRYMDLKSLSGGEKTLTALAFIFAVQEYQPASFYILDEIDAALDKQNSERLANLVAAYSDKAQYIVISHNDSVISSADTLFGVSMTDGVSKITSVKL